MILFAAGCGLAAAAGSAPLLERAAGLSDPLRAGLRRVRALRRPVPARVPEESLRPVAVGAAAGAAFGLLLGLGTASLAGVTMVAAALGAGAGFFVRRGGRDTARLVKLRQVAVLYEAVDFYTRAGYTIRQSLSLAIPLAPALRDAVEKCLATWPAGPVRALERLAEEINLPEAALLSSVLAHAEEFGIAVGRAAIEEESRSLEALRQTLAELKVVSKPMYFAMYRALPFAAIAGMMVGPLVYRLMKVMAIFFGGGF